MAAFPVGKSSFWVYNNKASMMFFLLQLCVNILRFLLGVKYGVKFALIRLQSQEA